MLVRSLSPSFAAVLTTCLAGATAQEWYLEHQNGPPPARRFHALGRVGAHTVLFGGVDEATDTVLGDTWRYDGIGWMAVPGNGPGARSKFAACADTMRGVLVVFGGSDASGQVLGDTWEFDGAAWLPVATPVAPAPRLGAAMAFDRTRNRVVMFGGGPTAAAPTMETWEYDGTTWQQHTPALTPSARQGHAMTFDTTRGVVMLFGGFTGSTFDAQSWTWNGTTWTQLVTATVPPASPFPALSFFEPHGVAVLTVGTGVASQSLQTFVHDGTDWSAGPIAPAGFTSRQGHATTFDARREMIVLFGGARVALGGAVPSADTWELSIRATFEPFGTGCAFTNGSVPMLDAVAGSRPQLGDTLQLEVAPAGTAALFAAGTSDTTFLGAPLPLELSPIGLPGCHLFTSADLLIAAPVSGGMANASFAIPPQRALLGAPFFVQALALDAGAAVPGATSNAGRATIGN